MGKKLRLPSLFKPTDQSTTTTWPWPTCINSPKTPSFRASNDFIFKTMNSTYLDKTNLEFPETPDSFFSFSNSSERQESFSSAQDHDDDVLGCSVEANIETVIRDLRSADRLFFEPARETSSILEDQEQASITTTRIPDDDSPFKESVAMAVDSKDPFHDFRASMEEMVQAHELKDWNCLEELLACYLKVNGKSNHGYIVGAFVDLLVHLSLVSDSNSSNATIDEPCSSSSSTATRSFTSPLSFSSSTSFTSPCLSSPRNEDENEIIVLEKNVDNASSSSSSIV